jgi:hypothetical protein
MPEDKHQGVSSESAAGRKQEAQENGSPQQNPHESVSGESAQQLPQETGSDMVVEDFKGGSRLGELEVAPGFDPTRAVNEGTPARFLTDEFTSLRSADELAPIPFS